jgi:NTP pyrophosphatase (non-canonical NTP hydrolase)
MKMNGMNNPASEGGVKTALTAIFEKQEQFQSEVTGIKQLPTDNVSWFSYHTNAMLEEMGEVLKADKRWKTHRNHEYNPENKLEEIADVFITAINISIFSGFSGEDIELAILKKIEENTRKLENERNALEQNKGEVK